MKTGFFSTKESAGDRAFMRLLVSSIVSIVLSMTCLTLSTWAWFCTGVESDPILLQASYYHVEEVACPILKREIETDGAQERYVFYSDEEELTAPAGTYTVTVTVSGTGKGYCKILLDTESGEDALLFTGEIPSGKHSFRLTLEESARITVIPLWGIYSGSDTLAVTPVEATA